MVRLGLFLSSYAPLFAILVVRFERPELVIGCAVLSILGAVLGIWILRTEGAKGQASYTIAKVDDKGSEVSGYIASYLLPFVTVTDPAPPEVAGYAIFLIVAAAVYMQSDLLQINPMFYLIGRRVLRVTTSSDWEGYLIGRQRPLKNETIRATTLATGVLVQSVGTRSGE